ncbi:diaminopimelate epimerase [Hymenobacter roseosalivarius DSM 11622]|uniref:Diaminopimelate epimerase n=1 Tax=Hymenobacter roseosalivarius DSM 11622 TaxID=645990 RepID=A0A1W1VU61_9BACT|nr:diaminopimelate epimerase [Hymenobacter roseosalivarius]SMB96434.1 diaminopimelate epimerase [Hymenobacter roseosalivarius DSM 11622]
MTIRFYKYQGTGNDFVMVDDRVQQFDASNHQLVRRLCDRRLGIGADGLILLRQHVDFDFEMVYFNADGYLGSMCGNGGRCTVAFAHHLRVIENETRFIAADGAHEAHIEADGTVNLRMQDVLGQQEVGEDGVFLNTGSPHIVRFLDPSRLTELNVVNEGRAIRYNERFRERGTNVNFAEIPPTPDLPWQVRTYERGVEDETLSCGTGVTAVALAASRRGAISPVHLRTPGGDLRVSFEAQPDGSFTNIYLNGPAVRVFEGSIAV